MVDFILYFEQVPAGFMAIDNPRIFTNVLPTSATVLPPTMMFVLLVDVGGRLVGSSGYWAIIRQRQHWEQCEDSAEWTVCGITLVRKTDYMFGKEGFHEQFVRNNATQQFCISL